MSEMNGAEANLDDGELAADTDTAHTSWDAPEADAAEQRADIGTQRSAAWPSRVPFDASEADAADQERYVELDEDDYR